MKKIVALILVLFLLITSTGTFVGCLGENENTEQSTIEITSPSTDDTTPEEVLFFTNTLHELLKNY